MRMIALLLLLALSSCAYNEYNITGNNNRVDGTVNAPKEVKTDVSGSGYGDVK